MHKTLARTGARGGSRTHMRKDPRRILSSTRRKNQQLTAIVGYCHELLQVAMAFRLTHNRIAIRKPQSGLVVGTKLGTFGSEADDQSATCWAAFRKHLFSGQLR